MGSVRKDSSDKGEVGVVYVIWVKREQYMYY